MKPALRAACGVALLVVPTTAWAHGFAPGYLRLDERRDGRVEALWKAPVGGEGGAGEAAGVHFPARCRQVARREAVAVPGAVLHRFALDCGEKGVGGLTLTRDNRGPETDVLVAVWYASGRRFSGLLRDDAASLTVPPSLATSRAAVVRSYVALGVRHIATGADHLAFVLGLLLLSRGTSSLVRTVTAFTLGHSVTLALAVLGVVRVASALVEATIAASVALLGVEALGEEGAAKTLTQRAPWAVAGGFGLLHGLGFAGALADAGLPAEAVPTALVGFNVGVELGQLAFVAVVGAALWVLARWSTVSARRARWAMGYAIGAAGVCWTLQRVAGMLR